MKFVPLSESNENQAEEGGKTLKFVPLADDAKPKRFVPLAETPADSGFAVSDPMGGMLPSTLAEAGQVTKRKKYTGSVFDTISPDEGLPFDAAEAERLSRRDYAQGTTQQARPQRQAEMREAPALPKRSARQAATDLFAAGWQGGFGFFKGIADNINAGDNPVSDVLGAIDNAFETGIKSPQLRNMQAARQGIIDAARKNQGELAASRAAFSTLFSPAGADVVARGAGSILPTLGMSLAQLSAKSITAATALSTAGEAANQTAQAMRRMSPEDWSKNAVYQELRDSGLSHRDAVSALVPIYALPAQTTGFLAGRLSGSTGLERTLAGKATSGAALDRAKRVGAELAGEQIETLAPQFVGNLSQAAIDGRTSPVEGLGQAAVETLAGSTPAAGLAALRSPTGAPAPTQGYRRDTSYEGLSELLARSKGFLTPEARQRVEPSFDLGPLGEERPGAEEPTIPAPRTVAEEDAAVYEEQYNTLLSRGIPPDSADRIAKRRVEEARKQRIRDTIVQPTEDEITARAKELIDAGVDPVQAMDLAAEQIVAEREADAQAQREGAVEPTAAERGTVGAGAGVVGQPSAVPPAGGAGVPQPSGMVPAGPDVAGTAVGEGAQPTPVMPERIAELSNALDAMVFRGQGVTLMQAATLKERLKDPNTQQQAVREVEALIAKEHPAVKLAREKAAEAEALRSGAVDLTAARAQQQAVQQTIASDFAQLQELAAQGRVDLGEVQDIQNRLQRGEDPMRVARDVARLVQEAGTRQAPGISEEGVAPQAVGEAANVPSAEAPKAKRGRPAVLTEEEKQQRAEAKKPTQAAKARAERSLARLTKTLDTLAAPPVEDDFDTDEEYQEALNEHKGKRREAIKELLLLNADPSIRGTKVGERIKAALARPDITAKEKADLQAGIDAQKRAAAAAQTLGPSASRVTKGAPDNAFTKFTNGVQALGHIIKTGNDFQKALGKRLRGFVTGVRFVVIEKGQELPAQLRTPKNARHWDRSIALYIENYNTGDRVIYVRGASFGENQGLNNLTILHELLHAATNRKISLAIEAIKKGADFNSPLVRSASDLLRTMNSAAQTFNEMARTGRLPEYIALLADRGEIFDDPREFIAYGMTDPEFQKFLMEAKGYEEDTSFFNRFVRGIRELFGMDEDTTNAFTDLIIVTDTILSSRAPRADLKGETVSQTAKGEEAPLEQVLRPLPPVLVARGAKAPSLKRRIDALLRRRKAGQLTDTQFAEEVDAVAETVESAKYQKVIPKRQRGADYIRQRILEAKRRGEISPEAADLAEWFILQNPALVDDLSISFRQATEGGVGGQYMDIPRIARIIKEKGNTGTIVHEVLHHLERMMPEPIRNAIRKEWYRQFLKAQDKASDDNQKKFFELLNTYHSDTGTLADFKAATKLLKDGAVPIEFYQYVNPSEFWAVNGTRIVEGNFAGVQGGLLTKLKNWLGKTAQKLKSLFGLSSDAPIIRALESLSKSDGEFVTDKLLQEGVDYFSIIPEDEDAMGNPLRTAKELKKDAQKAEFAVDTSRYFEELSAAPELMTMRDPKQVIPVLRDLVRRNWIGMSDSAKKALVATPTFTFLADWSGIPSLQDASKNLQLMNGMSNQLLVGAQKVINPVEKALNPFLFAGRKAELRKNLEDLIYESTIARYDPSDPNKKEVSPELDAKYAELGPEGQKLYKLVKDYYTDLIELYSDTLDQQIENLQGMTADAKQNLMLTLRRTFEAEARIKPYFPLVRYGDYWARITVDDAPVFVMFENSGDRRAALEKFAEDRGTTLEELTDERKVEFGEGTRKLRADTQGQSAMLTQIFDALDADTKDLSSPEAREALKDAIYQIYLTALPEQSFRNQFIRRKDRIGFSTDLVRNMATSASKMSYQLARLKYAPMLRNSIESAREVASQDENLQPFVTEAQERINLALQGPTDGALDAIAGAANKVGFLMYLSSAASALVQPVSLYISALPIIGANNSNMAGAAKELMRAVGDIRNYGVMTTNADGSTALVAPSLSNSDNLTADEKDAVRAMEDRGLARNTYASLVWQRQGIATDYDRTYLGRAKKLGKEAGNLAVGALMHNVERLTREAVFLAAYRVARKRFEKQGYSPANAHLAAIDQAANDVNESLADYDMTNRPRWMQTSLGKVAFQFKMFPLHMVLLLGTNFLKMMPLLNKEGKAAAAKKFFGIMLTTASVAGISGVPVIGSIIGAVTWMISKALEAMGMEDEDDELRKLDPMLWFRTVFLPEQLGEVMIGDTPLSDLLDTGPLNALTGAAIAERVGLADIFGRDTKEGRSSREELQGWVFENLGPTASTALSFADAKDAWALGDYRKAIEKITPAVIRNPLLAEKMAREGIKDSNGQVIAGPEEVTAWQIFMQGIGFRPAFVARASDAAFKLTSDQQKILNQKKLVLGRIKVQARKQTEEGDELMQKIIETELPEFNRKYPEFSVDATELRNTILQDAKARASSRFGFKVNRQNINLSSRTLDYLEERADRELRNKGKEK